MKQVRNTVSDFIRVCKNILNQAKTQGASLKDLYEISLSAGMPKTTLATFTTTFYKVV